ncbi:MAG: A/G-specific adenine glycosylase [Kiritimatiellae bacterium]|nr:A/G-specific adenine glycosylase [Kiritimatiellia bacterium]
MPPEALAALRAGVAGRLAPWFREHARAMPWRGPYPRDAYRVWVSETMLQQTRVDTVIGYFRRFLERFPDANALAAAPLGDVLKAWEGLGYYARARAMHRAAKVLAEKHGGKVPGEPGALAALPGFGPYTAAAVGSFAFLRREAVLDGNVARVLARVAGYGEDVGTAGAKAWLRGLAQALLPEGGGASAEANEAWMELGALVCTPRKPRCGECPLEGLCAAHRAGEEEEYPKKRKKMKVPHKVVGAAVILDRRNRIMIAQRRPEGGMLAGLWEFPGGKQDPGETMEECIARELKEEMGLTLEVGEELTVVHHAYSHFTIELHAHFARIRKGRPRHIECAGHAWTTLEGMEAYAFSKADLKIIEALRAVDGGVKYRDHF